MDEYIYHYGVKGMKWGVRKNRVLTRVAADVYRGKSSIQKKAC